MSKFSKLYCLGMQYVQFQKPAFHFLFSGDFTYLFHKGKAIKNSGNNNGTYENLNSCSNYLRSTAKFLNALFS